MTREEAQMSAAWNNIKITKKKGEPLLKIEVTEPLNITVDPMLGVTENSFGKIVAEKAMVAYSEAVRDVLAHKIEHFMGELESVPETEWGTSPTEH